MSGFRASGRGASGVFVWGNFMGKCLLVLLACVEFGFGQKATPLPCKPVTYFAVEGCELSGQGACPKRYHKQAVCPSDPRMKAPCRLMCVADGSAKKKKLTSVRVRGRGLEPAGTRTNELTAITAVTSER